MEEILPQKTATLFFVLAIAAFVCAVRAPIAFSQSAPPSAVLSGTVISSEGKPLEGIGVSARGLNNTFTTTVYTDNAGRYLFPPLENGQYKIWAQAVGFETSKAETTLSDGTKKQVDLKLATLADFHK